MELSDHVTVLERGEKTYYIVGTAHVSKKSAEEVAKVISDLKPDTVCVELCQTRYQTLTEDGQWRKLNIVQVIKQGKALVLLANLALSSFQRRMGDKLGVKPGTELLQAVNSAKEVGAELVLADRDIQITLKRSWSNLSLWKKMLVIGGLMDVVISSEEDITEEELEQMKQHDQINGMIQEFAKFMPAAKIPLVDERDAFLRSKLEEAEGEKIVAVVGAGHVKGILEHWGEPVDREKISEIPPASVAWKAFSWGFPLLIIALLANGLYGAFNSDDYSSFMDMLQAWILPNAIFAALGAIMARGHILTILTAAISAPITSLIPAIGAGMVAGLTEALLRKPTVEEAERIPEDIGSFKGFLTNGFTRVLLVFFMVNMGSVIGTWIGLGWLFKLT